MLNLNKFQFKIILITLILCLLFTILFSLIQRPKYTASTMIQLYREKPSYTAAPEDLYNYSFGAWYGDWPVFLKSQSTILKSKEFKRMAFLQLPDDLKNYLQTTYKDSALNNFIDSITITPILDSNLVVIEYTDRDPSYAAQLANFYVNFYRKSREELYVDFKKAQLAYLKKKSEELEKKIIAKENEYYDEFVKRNINFEFLFFSQSKLDEKEYAKPQKYDSSYKEYARFRTISVFVLQLIKYFKQNREVILSKLNKTIEDLNLPGNLKNLIKNLQNFAYKRLGYLASACEQILNQADSELQNELKKMETSYIEDFRKVKTIEYIIDEINSLRAEYTKLSNTIISLESTLDIPLRDFFIVNRAFVPEKPSRPNWLLNLLFAFIAGIILGCILAYILNPLSSKKRSGEEKNQNTA